MFGDASNASAQRPRAPVWGSRRRLGGWGGGPVQMTFQPLMPESGQDGMLPWQRRRRQNWPAFWQGATSALGQ